MKKLLLLLMLTTVMMTAASCQMFQGAGEDIEDAGDAVQDAVN